MNDLQVFGVFAKGAKKGSLKGGNCVIYTRVSTKEQADNNFSLETQKKACEQYAAKNSYGIAGYFGGTYESAKTDERREFNKMLSFVKRSSEKVAFIIVYSVDRFSRSGANAIYIADQLKQQGIIVCSVTQPTDATTASGSLQQNIQFIFSEYDNQQRREKCMTGVRDSLLRGEWCSSPPTGYDIVKSQGEKRIVVNETGKLLRKAFYWKAHDKLSTEEIRRKLSVHGLNLSSQRMSEIFRNPFYCGLLVHNLLEGQVVGGKQEKLVSQELFLQVNDVLSVNKQGYTTEPENDLIPLKQFYKCDTCGKYLRAYKAYKNQKYYYKCNTPGCNCNKRADELHDKFREQLKEFSLDVNDYTRLLVRQQMIASYNQLNEEAGAEEDQLRAKLQEVKVKIERLEERYILEEITRAMFDKYTAIFTEERRTIEQELSKCSVRVSNLEEYVDFAIEASSKLATAWDLGGYKEKQSLQFMVFPQGIRYNRKNDECRTEEVDELFGYFASLNSVLRERKSGNCMSNLQLPPLVARLGQISNQIFVSD